MTNGASHAEGSNKRECMSLGTCEVREGRYEATTSAQSAELDGSDETSDREITHETERSPFPLMPATPGWVVDHEGLLSEEVKLAIEANLTKANRTSGFRTYLVVLPEEPYFHVCVGGDCVSTPDPTLEATSCPRRSHGLQRSSKARRITLSGCWPSGSNHRGENPSLYACISAAHSRSLTILQRQKDIRTFAEVEWHVRRTKKMDKSVAIVFFVNTERVEIAMGMLAALPVHHCAMQLLERCSTCVSFHRLRLRCRRAGAKAKRQIKDSAKKRIARKVKCAQDLLVEPIAEVQLVSRVLALGMYARCSAQSLRVADGKRSLLTICLALSALVCCGRGLMVNVGVDEAAKSAVKQAALA
eukprot:6209083-Pleurochrysis_carterae.AAC.3